MVTRRAIVRVRDGAPSTAEDALAIEAPLEIRVGGKALTVVMRTPGHDLELVRGFLFSESIIRSLGDLLRVSQVDGLSGELQGNVVDVQLAPPPVTLGGGSTLGAAPKAERSFFASSSCGVCGKTSIADLAIKARPIVSTLTMPPALLSALPGQLRAAQTAFAETGGLHASGLFAADGRMYAAREDVGRHNALDKLIGWALEAGKLPLADTVLMVSGRVSFEIVQKAIVAGLPLIAAVSAPSSLAVELADRFGITLVGFLRGSSMNVYTHAARVV